jgi:hypothetical protein
MESLDYWRLRDEFTVIQAALLIIGEDPASTQHHIEDWSPNKRPEGYEAAKAVLCNAVSSKRLPAVIRRAHLTPRKSAEKLMANHHNDEDEPGWGKTIVSLDDLKQWLSARGIKSGFFFSGGEDKPDYLDPKHSRYAPKLAAAVNAWLAFEDPTGLRGKSPKQAMNKWLREHAAQYKLSDEEGKPNEQGIEECTKVPEDALPGWHHASGIRAGGFHRTFGCPGA